ncbi:MAG: hypothetical protein H6620_10450 [Halobacteriovoraceae bacterium]|nr:hypothetical protein [Halobacteriovoraceae bacterium]
MNYQKYIPKPFCNNKEINNFFINMYDRELHLIVRMKEANSFVLIFRDVLFFSDYDEADVYKIISNEYKDILGPHDFFVREKGDIKGTSLTGLREDKSQDILDYLILSDSVTRILTKEKPLVVDLEGCEYFYKGAIYNA